MMATFLVSGLIHERVRRGCRREPVTGCQLCIFCCRSGCSLRRNRRWGGALGLRRGVRGRLFVYLLTVMGPAGMLFSPAIRQETVVLTRF